MLNFKLFLFSLYLLLLTPTISYSDPTNQADIPLDCEEYVNDVRAFLLCEQVKATRELASAIKRIEDKLPNFKEF